MRVAAVVVLLAGWVSVTQAEVIVADTFTGLANGVSISGRAPETNLPNTSWTTSIPGGVAGHNFVGENVAGNPAVTGSGGQVSDALSLTSSGSYKKPTTFTISADFWPRTASNADSASNGRGIALGFYSKVGSGSFSSNDFTGLVLDSSGNLNLVQDPNDSGFFGDGSYKGTEIAYGGTFDTSRFYTLSYDVNTLTGHISNISLQGSTANYSAFYSTTLFTDAATKYAGVYTSGSGGEGTFDTFQVSSVPEPSAMALTVVGLIGLLAYAWRRRK